MGVQQTARELYTRNVVRIRTTVSPREPIVNGNTTKSTTSTTIMEAIINYNFIVKNGGCFSSEGNFFRLNLGTFWCTFSTLGANLCTFECKIVRPQNVVVYKR